MNRFTTFTLIGAAAGLALTATAASAQPRWMNINERQANLEQRIDRGLRNGDLTPREADNLWREFRQIARLENRYRSNGLSGWERADLDRRFDRLAMKIRYERRDNQYGYGYGRDYDRGDYGYDNRYDRDYRR